MSQASGEICVEATSRSSKSYYQRKTKEVTEAKETSFEHGAGDNEINQAREFESRADEEQEDEEEEEEGRRQGRRKYLVKK